MGFHKFVVFSVWACGVSARRRLFVNGTGAHFVALVCVRPLCVFSVMTNRLGKFRWRVGTFVRICVERFHIEWAGKSIVEWVGIGSKALAVGSSS